MAKNKLVADFIQWVLILVLSGSCLLLYLNGQTITKQSDFDKIKNVNLTKTNRRLSDSINFMHVNHPLTIVKYKLIHNGDTIYVNRKLAPLDDKIYNFTDETGSIKYHIQIKAKNISWYKVDLSVNENLQTQK